MEFARYLLAAAVIFFVAVLWFGEVRRARRCERIENNEGNGY